MAWKRMSSEIFKFDLGENKILEGELVGFDKFTEGDFGECYRYLLARPDGSIVSFVPGAAFDKMAEKVAIANGDTIRVEYRGKKDLEDGRRVNIFILDKWLEGDESPQDRPQSKKKGKGKEDIPF